MPYAVAPPFYARSIRVILDEITAMRAHDAWVELEIERASRRAVKVLFARNGWMPEPPPRRG